MKKVTLCADGDLIERARSVARSRQTSLNAEFRQWLIEYTEGAARAEAFVALMERLKHVNSGRTYSRDELNER